MREVTGLGLLRGINLERPAKPVVQSLFEQGILTGSCEGDPTQVRLLPPLTLSLAEALPFVDALRGLLAPR